MEKWPDAYPESLKKISWRIETKYDEVICGPLPYWTKMLPTSLKANQLFVKQVLTNYFWNNGCIQMLSDPVCRYFVKCFTVVYSEDEAAFHISPKKDKKTKKNVFQTATWNKLGLWSDTKEGEKHLKNICKAVVSKYNSMIKN